MERWIKAQSIGITAHALISLPVTERFKAIKELLRRYLLVDLGSDDARRQLIKSLPPSVLRLVVAATTQEGEQGTRIGRGFAELFKEVSEALSKIRCDAGETRLAEIQIWTYHALLGTVEATSLMRLGRSLFGKTWLREGEPIFRERLPDALQQLRNPWSLVAEKRMAIDQLFDGTALYSQTRFQIENILYQHLFCWPLLVISGGNANVGTSLPVGIDIQFNQRGNWRAFVSGGGEYIKLTDPNRKRSKATPTPDWIARLCRLQIIAKQLWRAKHGNHGQFRDEVRKASIHFSFDVAEQIVEELCCVGGFRIPISDGSADAYFAQATLSKLLGKTTVFPSAITGSIGDRLMRNNIPTLNYRFTRAAGTEAKLKYAFSTDFFERIVVPNENTDNVNNLFKSDGATESESASREPFNTDTELVFAHDMHDLADAVQPMGWRQFQYVRCPEISWAIHSERQNRPGLLASDNRIVQRLIEDLRSNLQPVVVWDVSPLHLASAFWHTNYSLREQLQPTPPSLSWAFIRINEWEKDSRFWQVIFSAAGACKAAFLDLLRHPNQQDAVQRIAKVLNGFEPDKFEPSHRSPDIIVIIGSKVFAENEANSRTPLSQPFLVSAILRALNNELVNDERLLPLIGKTRIILIPNDNVPDEKADYEELTTQELETIRKLAVFEWGFTQQTATLVLNESHTGTSETNTAIRMPGAVVRELLKVLVDKQVLRYGQGKYHIPRALIARLLGNNQPNGSIAYRHYSAGCALAPFVRHKRFPSLSLDAAFAPQTIHDAERHFSLAYRYAKIAGDQRVSRNSFQALLHLVYYGETPSWGVIRKLVDWRGHHLQEQTYEIAAEMLRWHRDAIIKPHPQHLILTASAAVKLLDVLKQNGSSVQWQSELRIEINNLFQEAVNNGCFFPTEETFARTKSIAEYTKYLIKHEPMRTTDIEQFINQTFLDLQDESNSRAVSGDWFDLVADREVDHKTAAKIYAISVKCSPEYAQLWIKGLGSASLSGSMKDFNSIRRGIRDVAKVIADSAGTYQKLRSNGQTKIAPVHISARWDKGFEEIKSLCQNDRELLQRLRSLKNDPTHTVGAKIRKRHFQTPTS